MRIPAEWDGPWLGEAQLPAPLTPPHPPLHSCGACKHQGPQEKLPKGLSICILPTQPVTFGLLFLGIVSRLSQPTFPCSYNTRQATPSLESEGLPAPLRPTPSLPR